MRKPILLIVVLIILAIVIGAMFVQVPNERADHPYQAVYERLESNIVGMSINFGPGNKVTAIVTSTIPIPNTYLFLDRKGYGEYTVSLDNQKKIDQFWVGQVSANPPSTNDGYWWVYVQTKNRYQFDDSGRTTNITVFPGVGEIKTYPKGDFIRFGDMSFQAPRCSYNKWQVNTVIKPIAVGNGPDPDTIYLKVKVLPYPGDSWKEDDYWLATSRYNIGLPLFNPNENFTLEGLPTEPIPTKCL